MCEIPPKDTHEFIGSVSSHGKGSSSIGSSRDESVLDTQISQYSTPDPVLIPEVAQPKDSTYESSNRILHPTTNPFPNPSTNFAPSIESGFGVNTKIPTTNKDGKGTLEPSCPSNEVLNLFLTNELERGREIGSFSQFLLALSYAGNCENAGKAKEGLDLPIDYHLQSTSCCKAVKDRREDYCKNVKTETDRYATFCDLANTILAEIYGKDGEKIYFMRNDPHNLKCDDYTRGRRPDIAFIDEETKRKLVNGPEENREELKWTNIFGISEMKLLKKTIQYIDCTEQDKRDKAVGQGGNSGGQTGSKREREIDTTDNNSRKKMKTVNGEKKVGPSLRSSEELKKFLQQSARFACDHMTSDPLRDHVIHLLIRDGELWLAYYDHDGLLFSPPLDFVNDLYHFTYLLKVLSDFGCSEHGYCGTSEPVGVEGKMTALRFTSSTGEDEEFVVMEEGYKAVNRSLSGAHTQARKVLMKEDVDGKIVPLKSSEVDSVQDSIKSEHILKWSRPLANQISEPDMIRTARRVLRKTDQSRKLEKFLPKILYTKDIDRRIMQFRAMLSSEYKEKRILRLIIIENLEPLYFIDDLGNFKSAVIDIVLGIHHLAISKEGIRHRNITINSLMFRCISGGKVQGVLNDWDSACNKDTEGIYNGDGMLVGTRPFIAKDLHVGRPSRYYERFDFESLLYSLYWICIFYAEGKSRPTIEISETTKFWTRWNSYEDRDIYLEKTNLVLSGWDENYFSKFFLPLVWCWLAPLRTIFKRGYSARDDFNDMRDMRRRLNSAPHGTNINTASPSLPEFDDETLGRNVTFERIYDILRGELI